MELLNNSTTGQLPIGIFSSLMLTFTTMLSMVTWSLLFGQLRGSICVGSVNMLGLFVVAGTAFAVSILGTGILPSNSNSTTQASMKTFIGCSATLLVLHFAVTFGTLLTIFLAKERAGYCPRLRRDVALLNFLVALGGLTGLVGIVVVFSVSGSSLPIGFNALIVTMDFCWSVILCVTEASALVSFMLVLSEDGEDGDWGLRVSLGLLSVPRIATVIIFVGVAAGTGSLSSPNDLTNSTVTPESNAGYNIGVVGFNLTCVTAMTSGIVLMIVAIYWNRITAALYERRMGTRLKSSKALLEEALRRGYVESQTAVCLLIGVAGAGKTHTIHLLLQKSPPECRNSTPLAERPVRAVRVSATSGELREISTDELDNILADSIAVGVPLERRSCFCCFGSDQSEVKHQTISKGISQPSHSNGTSGSLHSSGATQSESPPNRSISSNTRSCCCCWSISHNPESELQETAESSYNETAHLISASELTGPQQPLHQSRWIYLIDSGGQIEFLEVLPAFLQHTSVCFFLTKLTEMLSEHPKLEYFEEGKSVGEPSTCAFTNEEMLMRCVQTIQSQCVLQDGNADQISQVVVVGTHKDLEHECPEKIDEKNKKLRSILCPAFERSLVFKGEQTKELIFPLNAKNPGPEDHALAGELTNVIADAASDTEARKTPISWFKFEQYLQKLSSQGTRILRREECFQIARSFHLSKKDFDAALDHLASFCVIHYYFHLLPGVVFIDPHFLVGIISELVKYHYKIRHDPDVCKATRGDLELRKFQNEGCITLKLLKKIPMQYTDYFTAADLLKLTEDRLIITRHISKDEYFMPCLLRTMDSEEVDQHRLRSSSPVAPLAIHFSCGWVPHGMYCSLVAFLRSQKSSPWKLCLDSDNPTEPLCLTRNCIEFKLPGSAPGSLILIDSFSHFEVHIVNAPYNVCNTLCPSIWQTLSKGLQKAKETLRYKNLEEPKRAFLCMHGNDLHTGRPHLASPADDVNYWSCDLYPGIERGPLTDEHLVWFPERRGTPTEEALPHTRESIGTTTYTPTHTRAEGPMKMVFQRDERTPIEEPPSHSRESVGSNGESPVLTYISQRSQSQSVLYNPSNPGVKSKLNSAEYLAFRKCFADFAVGISNPELLSLKLYSEGLIDQTERMKAGNMRNSLLERNQTLLSAVEQQIRVSPASKFRDFLRILHSEPSLEHLATMLEVAYDSVMK